MLCHAQFGTWVQLQVQVTFNETKAIAEQAAEGRALPLSRKNRDDYVVCQMKNNNIWEYGNLQTEIVSSCNCS